MRMAVIGAGLQGAGIALEAVRRGVTVDLFEKHDTCLGRASLHNEGKLHLGFVYANDPTLRTARLLALAALHFEPIVAGWLGLGRLPVRSSRPFLYVVHPGSMLAEDALAAYWTAVTQACRDAWADGVTSYLGGDPRRSVRRLRRHGLAMYETPEAAIDPVMLAGLVRDRLVTEPHIRLRTGTTVQAVEPGSAAVVVTFSDAEGRGREAFDHVVNASWEDLVAIDRTAGLQPPAPWSFRLKRFLRVRAPELAAVDSATIVHGPFGDVVNYGDGDVYLSWYPAGCRSVSHDVRHPDWPVRLVAAEEAAMKAAIVAGLSAVLPDIDRLERRSIERGSLDGGIIYALGNTGIEDRGSLLHQRSATGPRSLGRYHSVDTGKWTTAPWFARQFVTQLCGGA